MTFPCTVKEGSASVKIYRTPVKVKGKKYDAYTVRFYHDGKPQQKKFGKLDGPKGALTFANATAAAIDQGAIGSWMFSEEKKHSYERAEQHLAGTGISVDHAAHIVAEMVKILSNKVPPIEAAKFYARQHPHNSQSKTVKEVFDEALAHKSAMGLRDATIRSFKIRAGKFASDFSTLPVSHLNSAEIDTWLSKFKPKNRNNYRGCISTLISYAKTKRYLARDFAEIESVPVAKARITNIQLYSPGELEKLFLAANRHQVIFLAIAAFAGVRHQAIMRLHWEHIRFADGVIAVDAESSKVTERYLAPITPTLKAWLWPVREKTGRVVPVKKMKDSIARLEANAGIEWKKNALRHTFISCRVAITQNKAQTAEETNTSEWKIRANYLKRLLPREAKKWMDITPEYLQIRHKFKWPF